MNKMNLTKQIWMAIGFLCCAILGLGTFGYFEAKYLYGKLNAVSTVNLPVADAMANTDMMHDNIRSNVYGALYHFSQANWPQLEAAFNDNKEAEKKIKANMEIIGKSQLSEKTKQYVTASDADLENYISSSNTLIQKLVNKNQQGLVTEVQKFEESFKALEEKLDVLGKAIEKETTTESENASGVLSIFLFSAIGIFALGLFIGYYTVHRLTLNLKKYTAELDQSSNLVKSISENLSASNVQLSSSATEAAASLEETVASLEELSSMISLNTDNSKKAFQISEQAQFAAETGDKNIRDLSAAMLTIKNDSKKMEDIVNVIDDISFQTNLLALNAAVEAARAGEQGKGFAVVADAVRSLAQRSSASAKEINQMIKESVDKIEKGSVLANECNQSLKNIFEHVKSVTQLSGQIAQASAEQTTGLKQINQAMIQLDSTSQENASTAEEISRSANEANIQSDNMNHVVGQLTEFIFGQGSVVQPVKPVAGSFAPKPHSKSNVLSLPKNKNRKASLDLGPEPENTDIKKVENF
jgi:methyl-accepting chemotaxis protein